MRLLVWGLVKSSMAFFVYLGFFASLEKLRVFCFIHFGSYLLDFLLLSLSRFASPSTYTELF